MIESPLIGKIRTQVVVETTQDSILTALETRFGPVPKEVAARVRAIKSERRLNALIKHAVKCKSLSAFEAELRS